MKGLRFVSVEFMKMQGTYMKMQGTYNPPTP